jgi:hypothetical protein
MHVDPAAAGAHVAGRLADLVRHRPLRLYPWLVHTPSPAIRPCASRAIWRSSSAGTMRIATRLVASCKTLSFRALASGSEDTPRKARPDRISPHPGVVFADPAGENHGVKAPHRCDHAAGMPHRPIAKCCSAKDASALSDTCSARRSLARQGPANRFRGSGCARPAQPVQLGQPQDGIAVDRSGPRAHRQPVQRRIAHRRRNRTPVHNRAKRAPLPRWQARRRSGKFTPSRQDAHQSRIADPVKAIAAQAPVALSLGKGIGGATSGFVA